MKSERPRPQWGKIAGIILLCFGVGYLIGWGISHLF